MANGYEYLDTSGVIVPDTSSVQADVEAEYREAFGQDLVVTPNTPQGVLITAEVSARSGVLRNNAAVANQINPNLAAGVFLDAILALTGSERLQATKSTIAGVQLLGLPGTVVPAGAQASLADGTLFETVTAVTLDGLGSGVVEFQAVDAGPIAANPGALTQIVTAVLGWDSVTNPNAATVGRALESDAAARARRRNELSVQNVALAPAIVSGLYATEGVRSLSFRENTANTAQTIDGILLDPHSIYACVDGGTDAAVAASLLEHKSLGAGWNGAQTVTVVEPASGQSYVVKFDRPAPVPVKARLTVRNVSAIGDVTDLTRQAILDYAAGLVPGEPGFTVGTSVSAFELAGAVNLQAVGVFVLNCEISLVTPTAWGTAEIPVAIDEIATILSGDILVTVV